MTKILQKEAKELRVMAREVPIDEIGSKKIKTVLENMAEALEGEEDGVAIAAPQIGENLRIFIVSHRAFEMFEDVKNTKEKSKEGKTERLKDKVFINPEITKLSKEKEMMEEGCLSVRYLYGKVLRSKKTTVKAYDENGKRFTMGGSGILAQIFQHETDHLDGVLFIDEAVDLEEIPPNKESRSMNQESRIIHNT